MQIDSSKYAHNHSLTGAQFANTWAEVCIRRIYTDAFPFKSSLIQHSILSLLLAFVENASEILSVQPFLLNYEVSHKF